MFTSRWHLVACVISFIAFQREAISASIRHPFGSRFSLGKQNIHRAQVRPDLLPHCEERWRNATLDHFTWAKHQTQTFRQRYFVCSTYWRPGTKDEAPGPIFFYLGNEANVLLYLNNTGLMWESAHDFGALLVFAEHRYYGESLPFKKEVLTDNMGYLSAEQAMADYAEIVSEVKAEMDAQNAAVIGFGGSYGGMLATWFRIKYPHVMDGAIAASAPIWVFYGEKPETNAFSFARGTTFDASAAGGSAPACVDNVRRTWKTLASMGKTQEGRDTIHQAASLCPKVPLKTENDVIGLRDWLAAAWDMMAMGNYPYPSGYILNGVGLLPAFPVRAACQALAEDDLEGVPLLQAMVSAVGVYYNNSGTVPCYDYGSGANEDSDQDGRFWDFQYCTEMLMPFSRDGVQDMFWPEPFDLEATKRGCLENWGVQPDVRKATIEWGGRRIASATNLVFSNGLLDPWHGGGVLEDLSDSLIAAIIPEGAHHLDLMWSHPDDPESVIECRKFERAQIAGWVKQVAVRNEAWGTQRAADKNKQRVFGSGGGTAAAAAAAAGQRQQRSHVLRRGGDRGSSKGKAQAAS